MSESDQHGPRRAILLLSTTLFEKGLITVINKVKLHLVFIVPAVAFAYRSRPPPTLSLPLTSVLSPLVVSLLVFGQ